MIPAYLLLSVMALELFVAVKLNAKSKRLQARERQVDCAHLANLAYARLLGVEARLGGKAANDAAYGVTR